jgi:very-short-patch-repair endonuclease
MHSLHDVIHDLDDLAATNELLALGFGKKALSHAANYGHIVRVRQGWYSIPDVHPVLLSAVRVGGRLGCVSAAALYGMWSPPHEHLHVSLNNNDCRLRTPEDMRRRLRKGRDTVTTHWNTKPMSGSRLLLDPISCLAEVMHCQPIEYAVAIANSALRPPRLGAVPLVSRSDWQQLADTFITRAPLLRLADGVCESGTESVTWVRLFRFKLPIRRQVWIDGKRVDFLIGRRLVVEVDGAAYHIDPVRFELDRTRDAQLCALEYIVLRFSYNQVIYRWSEVEVAVLAAVAGGLHR